MNYIVQGLSILGLLFNVASFQPKKKSILILLQLLGGLMFCIHFFMLGAYTGFLLNTIGVFRATVFSFKNMKDTTIKIWTGLFISLFLMCYVLTFLVFDVKFSVATAIIELLPILGMCCVTVSFGMTNAGQIRAMSAINSPSWLVYNIYYHSLGGILCELLCISSIVIGIIRHDVKKEKANI